MKRLILNFSVISILLFVFIQTNAQKNKNPELSNRIVYYKIDAKLDTKSKNISAKMKMSWLNNSSDTVSELMFHTYMNAFKNTASTFMKESGGQLRGNFIDADDDMSWGWIDINKITDNTGKDLTSKLNYTSPDDNNAEDQTVFSLKLSKAVNPGEKAELIIDFEVKLPKIFARSGYSDNYFFVAQWFPKIGVYESDKSAWNCHQYHANSEFFADFGVYDVSITVPKSYKTGATGIIYGSEINADGTKTVKFIAEDVIDFAWTASERYKIHEYIHNNISVKIMLQPEHYYMLDRHVSSVNTAIDYFEKTLGKYPYKNITVVDPPAGAAGSGGMEYPMLITAGSFRNLPKGIRFTEMVVIHEFGHQYFMGILASNEFEEAWLDEGLNSYLETRIMDETFGNKSSIIDFWGLHIGDADLQRSGYIHGPHAATSEVLKNSWEYNDGEYSVMSYNKPATFLFTLDNMIGREVMDMILKSYYEKFKFKHPKTQDFIDISNEIAKNELENKFGTDLNWFFNQALRTSAVCDYQVYSIKNNKLAGFAGTFDKGNIKTFQKTDYSKNNYLSTVTLRRNGNFIMPVEVLIEFDNGDNVLKQWDGKAGTFKFEFKGSEQIISAKIDPYNKILLDKNFINNSKTVDPQKAGIFKYVLKFLFRLQNILQSISFFA